MTTNQCQCDKTPCVCGTGLCNEQTFADSAKIENIDENGNIHYVESIYQKISLKIFENIECCVAPQNPNVSPINPPDNNSLESRGDSNQNSTPEEEKQESIECIECCDHMYSPSLPDEKHECKDECNITAELYCQIKRQNSEPGETFSECSTSSSSDESDEEIIGDGSTDYVSAQGRSEEFNSEGTLEDEDSFNANIGAHSSVIEADDRIYCQDKSCCSFNSQQKCNYNKSKSNTSDDQKYTDKSTSVNQNIAGDTNKQNNLSNGETLEKRQVNEEIANDTIEVFNENTENETKWTTIHPKTSRHKRTKKLPIKIEDDDTNNQEDKDNDSAISVEIKSSMKVINILEFYDENLPNSLLEKQSEANENSKEDTTWSANTNTDSLKNPDEPTWKTIVPEIKEKFSGQSWKRENLEKKEQTNIEDQSIIDDNNNKPSKQLTTPKESKEIKTDRIEYIVNNRKRKYGSEPNVFTNTTIRFERDSSVQNDFLGFREERKSFSGRKRRITLSNFVTEEQLKKEHEVPETNDLNKPLLKPEHTDACFLLDKSTYEDNKRPWDTYVPCERSDFSIIPVDSFIKKFKKNDDAENKPKTVNVVKKSRQQSFIRQDIAPIKPNKFLCFKYIPNVSAKTSSTSTIQDNLIQKLAIDPPDFSLPSTDLPQTKFQGSRIPVAQSKYKTGQKRAFRFDLLRTPSLESKPSRRQTVGVDEIRNVMEQKCSTYRRSIIPPEERKSYSRKKSVLKKSFLTDDAILEASTSEQLLENSMQKKKKAKQVVLLDHVEDDGSDTSLRNKMKQYYTTTETLVPLAASTPIKKIKGPGDVWQKNKNANREEKTVKTKGKNKNELQKTCCSQTGIHVCIKESVVSDKGKEESNIVQMVNIDVTPKNSKFVKLNVMPTVPEINKEGIITIPVQFQLCSEVCKGEMQAGTSKESVEMTTTAPKVESREKLLYEKHSENNWHECYMEQYLREDVPPHQVQEEPYVNLLWTKMKNTLSDSHKEENKTTAYDSVEIQTDLSLGQKLLSKSLSSLTSKDSSSSVKNKSEPVKKSGIDWNDILLPPPGSFVIKKMPSKKAKRRFSGDSNKNKDNNNIPSTSGGLPPTEEIKPKQEPSESVYPKFKLKCCCSPGKSHEEPYKPTNKKSEEEVTKEEPQQSEEEPKSARSKIISLVFSESFYDIDNYTCPLHQKLVEEDKLISPCTSKPELPWTNILLPIKPQIRRIEKLDISKTSTSITDQTFTDEYNSASPSPKNTDTCPNLSENSTHTCDCNKNYNDKGTNTSIEEDCETVPCSRKSNTTSNMSTYSTDILKSFKEDPVLSAFKAFEEELKPVRKALAEVQSKLRALNIPELECLFKKDPISEYAISRSNSQIGQSWEYRQPATPHIGKWSSDFQKPVHCFRQWPSEHIEYHRRSPYDDYRVYQFATPTIPIRSRNLSTDIWKSFGSCDRNTIKCPYEKFWKPPNPYNTRNARSYNCPAFSSINYESRNSTPESEFHYVPFDSSGIKRYYEKIYCPYFRNTFDKRVEMINDDDDLDYPPTYRNTPNHSHVYSQQECFCDSEHSLYSNTTEELNSNHVLTNFPPKFSSSFHTPTIKHKNKYIPVKVRPVTQYYSPDDDGVHGLQKPKHISTRNTSINLKNGKVYARTKIELPNATYKRANNTQKNVRKIFSQPNERNHSQSEYEDFRYNTPPNDCTVQYSSVDDNFPIYSNCYKEYLKNERYA